MGGAPRVAGGEWLELCGRQGWHVDTAFALLFAIEDAYPKPKDSDGHRDD